MLEARRRLCREGREANRYINRHKEGSCGGDGLDAGRPSGTRSGWAARLAQASCPNAEAQLQLGTGTQAEG